MGYREKSDSYFGKNGDDELKSSLRNLTVGATPVLLDFLTGKTAQMKVRGFQKANEFTKSLADEKGVEVDVDGEPVLMPEGEAMFRKPYHKPEKTTLADTSNVFAVKDVFNKDTNQRETITVLKDGRWVKKRPGGELIEVDPESYEKDLGVGSFATRNEFDEAARFQFSKNAPEQKRGLGQDISSARKGGFKSREEEKAAMTGIKDVNTQGAKLQSDIETAQSALKQLVTKGTDLTPESAAIAIQSIIRPINVDRMSDSDYVRMRGGEFKSLVQKFESWLKGTIKGKMTQREVDAYIEASSNAIKTLKDKQQSIKSTILPKSSYSEKANKFIGEKTGGIDGGDWKSFKEGLKAR